MRRTDRNHTEIAKAFRDLGCTVADTSMVGDGFGDIVVGVQGVNLIIEIKDPLQNAARRKPRRAARGWGWCSKEFHVAWRGQITVIETPAQAVTLVSNVRSGLAT